MVLLASIILAIPFLYSVCIKRYPKWIYNEDYYDGRVGVSIMLYGGFWLIIIFPLIIFIGGKVLERSEVLKQIEQVQKTKSEALK
jgi:hypothetical protein